MNLPFSFRQKTKIALFLFCIMVCSILIRVLEDKSIKNMGAAFVSIYNDRLVPATDLFQLSQYVYGTQHLMENYINSENGRADKTMMINRLKTYDVRIDSLLKKYEKTYLVANEKGNLIALKAKILETRSKAISTFQNSNHLDRTQLKEHYNSQVYPLFDEITNSLAQLTRIQSDVGAELISESQSLMSGSRIYSTIQLVLAITIGILIVSILFTTNIIKVRPTSFNLN